MHQIFVLLMVKHISILNIFISKFYIVYYTWWSSIYWKNQRKIQYGSNNTKTTTWIYLEELGFYFLYKSIDLVSNGEDIIFCIRSCPYLIACYRHEDGQYRLAVWPGFHHMHSKIQQKQYMMVINETVIKQAQNYFSR